MNQGANKYLWDQLQQAAQPTIQKSHQLVVVDADEFLMMDIPVRKSLLTPWLSEQGLAMVYAPRGVGKTFFAMNVAYAIASGGKFLKWEAPEPRRILYIDGEMPASAMQERLANIVRSHQKEANKSFFKIFTPDLQKTLGTFNLSTRPGQILLEPYLDEVDLIVVDNLSTLCHGGNENDADSWSSVQDWALNLRSRGKSILFVHHAGKGGNQRGTSRREDILDTVISLKQPADYSPTEGASFEIHFEKSRGFCGEDAEPLKTELIKNTDSSFTWNWHTLENTTYEKVIELHKEKIPQADIARELNLNRSTISRYVKKAKSEKRL